MTNRLRGYTRQKRLGNTGVDLQNGFLPTLLNASLVTAKLSLEQPSLLLWLVSKFDRQTYLLAN